LSLRYAGTVEDQVYAALSLRFGDIFAVLGQLPDGFEDDWIDAVLKDRTAVQHAQGPKLAWSKRARSRATEQSAGLSQDCRAKRLRPTGGARFQGFEIEFAINCNYSGCELWRNTR
jgi:hypothetical protein